VISESEFMQVKYAKIASLNREYSKGLDREWSVFLKLCGTRKFRTVLDEDGKCIDLVEHNDSSLRNIRHMNK